LDILQKVFEKLNPGASFAVHSDDIVAIGLGMDWIIKGGFGVNLQLEEVWSRWI